MAESCSRAVDETVGGAEFMYKLMRCCTRNDGLHDGLPTEEVSEPLYTLRMILGESAGGVLLPGRLFGEPLLLRGDDVGIIRVGVVAGDDVRDAAKSR